MTQQRIKVQPVFRKHQPIRGETVSVAVPVQLVEEFRKRARANFKVTAAAEQIIWCMHQNGEKLRHEDLVKFSERSKTTTIALERETVTVLSGLISIDDLTDDIMQERQTAIITRLVCTVVWRWLNGKITISPLKL
jgi:hypothetical protein